MGFMKPSTPAPAPEIPTVTVDANEKQADANLDSKRRRKKTLNSTIDRLPSLGAGGGQQQAQPLKTTLGNG